MREGRCGAPFRSPYVTHHRAGHLEVAGLGRSGCRRHARARAIQRLLADNTAKVDSRIGAVEIENEHMMQRENDDQEESDSGSIEGHFFREIQIELLIHDLEDPFLVIETGLRNLMNKRGRFGPLTPEQERTLHRSLRATIRGRSMLSILLEVGRSEFGRITPNSFSPAKVLRSNVLESIELLGPHILDRMRELDGQNGELASILASEGIGFDFDGKIEKLEIFQDEYTFGEIAGNLIKNALRFRKEKIEIKCYKVDEQLAIEISDDGQGIPAENHDLIFQPFAQADFALSGMRRGRGLGLAAARVLARRLGGDITVHSDVGRGAKFVFTIPVTSAPF